MKVERIISDKDSQAENPLLEAFEKKIDSRFISTNLFIICSNFITDNIIVCINGKKGRIAKAQGIIVYKPDGTFTVEKEHPLVKAIEDDFYGVTDNLIKEIKNKEDEKLKRMEIDISSDSDDP